MEPTQPMQPTQTDDSNKGFYIALAVMGLIIIGLAIAIIIVAVNKGKPAESSSTSSNASSSSSGSNSGTGTAENEALAIARRNTERTDDLARIITAANAFQTNNNGKTPWHTDSYGMDKFVQRYIDETCGDPIVVGDTYSYICSGDDFRDPDGSTYSFRLLGSMNPNDANAFDGDVAAVAGQWPNDHAMMVVNYAFCGYNEGKTVQGTGERQYAVLYLDESGAMHCMDNH